MKNIQMNTSVTPDLRDRIQKASSEIGLTSSDAMSLLPGALYQLKQECKELARRLLSGETTIIPLCYLTTFFGVDLFNSKAQEGDHLGEPFIYAFDDFSFDELYRTEFIYRNREFECTLIDAVSGTIFIGDYFDDNGAGSIRRFYHSKNFWSIMQKHFKGYDGKWTEDIPLILGGNQVAVLKKDTM